MIFTLELYYIMKVSKGKSTQLFELIKSLSPAEKRYFRLFSTVSVERSDYYDVFKAIDGQEVYDERLIKEKFSDRNFTAQFHVIKNYLKDLILRALRNFHHKASKNGEVKDILRNVEILNNKELYNLMDSELSRAERIAVEYELWESQLEILDWRRRFGQHINPQDHEIVRKISVDQEKILARIENKLTYYKLIADVASSIYENTAPGKDESLLEDIGNAKTFESKILHYNSVYFKEIRDENGEKGAESLSEFVEFMESFPNRLTESPGMYASTVNNLISYEIFSRNFRKAGERIEKLKEVYASIKAGKRTRSFFRNISRTYNLELEVIRDSLDVPEHSNKVLEIEKFVLKNRMLLPNDYLLSFRFQLASIFFRTGNFDRALKWVNEILEIREETRLDILLHARFLNLMIHYEKSNVFVLRYFVDSTRRFIRKSGGSQPFYDLLLKFFSRIGKAPVFEHGQHFSDLMYEFEKLEEAGKFPSADLDYVDYRSWVQSKVT